MAEGGSSEKRASMTRRGTTPAEPPRSAKGLSLSAGAAEGVSSYFTFGYVSRKNVFLYEEHPLPIMVTQ